MGKNDVKFESREKKNTWMEFEESMKKEQCSRTYIKYRKTRKLQTVSFGEMCIMDRDDKSVQ